MIQTPEQLKTRRRREDADKTGTYDVYIEIDIDCEELVDACGLDYTRTEDDDTQNEVCISLDKDEFTDVVDSVAQRWTFDRTFPCEQDIATAVLNPELGEYTTKVTVYTPSGDKIIFK